MRKAKRIHSELDNSDTGNIGFILAGVEAVIKAVYYFAYYLKGYDAGPNQLH